MAPLKTALKTAGFALFGLALKPSIKWLSRRRLPQVDGALSLPGRTAPVEVIRDRWGVPHIYAESRSDLFFAQGFVHAQDRLWQMEVNRRISCGRLSELIGPKSLETYRIARILGFRRTAARDLRDLPRGILKSLEAYSDGVNACIDGRGGLPVEFTLLRYRPDPWIPLDSLSFIRLMTWGLSFGWTADLIASRLVEALGADLAKDLHSLIRPAT